MTRQQVATQLDICVDSNRLATYCKLLLLDWNSSGWVLGPTGLPEWWLGCSWATLLCTWGVLLWPTSTLIGHLIALSMGVGRGAPWILKISAKKCCFLSFEWEKTNFTTFGPSGKVLEKWPAGAPLKKSFRHPWLLVRLKVDGLFCMYFA